jgi:hypothetical protein
MFRRCVSYGQAVLRGLLVLKVGGDVGWGLGEGEGTHTQYDLPKSSTSRFRKLLHSAD